MKPYYQDSAVTIYHGDCREVVPTLGRFDLLLTDPPYGIGKEKWDVEFPEYAINLFFSVSEKVCVIPGIWALGRCIQDMGSRFCWVVAGHKKDGMTNGKIGINKWQPAVLGGSVGRIGSDAFDFSQVDKDGVGLVFHSCQKPLSFMHWLVEKLTVSGNTVIDPFAGSGTTGRAAKDLGRKAVLIEREEKYCEIAARRMGQEVLCFDNLNPGADRCPTERENANG